MSGIGIVALRHVGNRRVEVMWGAVTTAAAVLGLASLTVVMIAVCVTTLICVTRHTNTTSNNNLTCVASIITVNKANKITSDKRTRI